LNFAGTEASGTDAKLYGRSIHQSADGLQIRLPYFFGPDMRMADLHTDRPAFSTDITFKRQGIHLLFSYHQAILSRNIGNCNKKIQIGRIEPMVFFEPLTEEKILQGLDTGVIGRKIQVFQDIDSTNDEVRRLAEAGEQEGLVVLAEKQQKGRGRQRRPWVSSQGTGLWFSILLRPDILPEKAPETVFMSAAAVCGALKVYTGLSCFLKWPNDILWEGKKLCGILTEMNGTRDKLNYIVLGIGINVNQSLEDFPPELRLKASSLAMAAGKEWNRTPLLQAVLSALEKEYKDYLNAGFEVTLGRWRQLCGIFQKNVRISLPGEVLQGVALDVDAQGALLVETPQGLERVTVGDVSVGAE
jgi:BirA family biotin operon repressor/biotin-[acetyl-CoA-carboxylase] ligase